MNPGRMLIASVVLAGLAIAVVWSNRTEKAKVGQPSADKAVKILSIKEDQVKQIDIKRRTGESTTVKFNDSGRWQITSPVALDADAGAVATITSASANLNAERVVDENATDLASYGLAPPLLEVDIGTKDGKTTKLLLGENTPAGNGVYAKLDGDPRLFTTGGFNKSTFDKVAKDLRDKRLLKFDQEKLSRIEFTAKKQTYEFGKTGANEWQIVKPKAMRVDAALMDGLVIKLKAASMDTSGADEDAKKAAAAFSSAPVTAVVKVTDPGGTETLEVRKAKDTYYAKSSVADGVSKLAKEMGDSLDQAPGDFRNKKVFDFGFSDPTRVEVKDGAKNAVYEKSGEKWTSAGKTTDSTSIQAFLDKLRDLSATKFPEAGFTTPAVTLTVVSNGGKRTEKVEIAAAGASFIARRDGESSLYELDANAVKDLRQAAGDIREAQPEKKQPEKKK
jgi:hypothetical protein